MGGGAWRAGDWKAYSSARIKGKSVGEIYSAVKIDPKYDPKNIKFRESRDSDDHPVTTPIIIGLDVTGSMSRILSVTAQKLGDLVKETLERNPVEGPQILFGAIGDSTCDSAPLQATQFESDIRIASQLTELWFERGGGGNNFESYPLMWYFAANKTRTDAWEKRQKKGIIFTMGDDCFPTELTVDEIKRVFGDTITSNIDTKALLEQVSRKYDVFHLMLMQGGSAGIVHPDKWHKLMGERAITVTDYNALPQIMVSILESVAGKDKDEIISSWDGDTRIAVQNAIGGLSKTKNSFMNKIIKW
ncbi:MAG: hypothetical protein J6I55_02465 [Ruminococcus sp.]|jgi:hypothetical protein|nr:hypothetical protein [Ruminococcus sp.]